MEIHRMACLSTAHLSLASRHRLDTDNMPGLIFFPKGQYGWFVHVPDNEEDLTQRVQDIPADIKRCLAWALAQGMQWLVFDGDGPVVEGITLFEEVEPETSAPMFVREQRAALPAGRILMGPLGHTQYPTASRG